MRRVTGMFLILIFLVSFKGNAQVTDAQAMFIYNFSRLVEWPSSAKSGEFTIGVLGNSQLTTSLTGFVAGKKVGGQSINIKQFGSVDEISDCHILFVSFGKSSKMSEIQGKLNGTNSLIIGEKKDLVASGAAISFVIDENKLRFQLNKANAERYQLKVSKSLEEMAML